MNRIPRKLSQEGFGNRESQAAPFRRVMALDYGSKRIGVALSDELGLTARPFVTFTRTNRREDLRRLREICLRHNVAQIVVGHPIHMSGEAGKMAHEAARFAIRIGKETGLAVELADERLTSWEAKQTLAAAKSRRKRGAIDDVAAAVLLREFLDRKRLPNQAFAAEKG